MPTLKIEISLDSDAMVANPGHEVALMLTKALPVLESPEWTATRLRDSNGNHVGDLWVEEDDA